MTLERVSDQKVFVLEIHLSTYVCEVILYKFRGEIFLILNQNVWFGLVLGRLGFMNLLNFVSKNVNTLRLQLYASPNVSIEGCANKRII